jgi:hypothetical protein
MEVQWNGSRAGNLSGAAIAGWCAVRRLLEIRMVHGDTGIALVLYPAKELSAGEYPVVEPAKAESARPAAGLAVRWLTENTVQGFQSRSGRVNLERSGTGQLSGRLIARTRSVIDTQRLAITGSFRDLAIVQDTLGCSPSDTSISEEDPELDDTGVD